LAARREEDLGGGRASWLVPFDVISRNTKKPPATRKREKNMEEVGKTSLPLLKVPPPPPRKVMRRGKKKVEKKGESLRRKSRRKKRC
jgi:hypothetical protein